MLVQEGCSYLRLHFKQGGRNSAVSFMTTYLADLIIVPARKKLLQAECIDFSGEEPNLIKQ
jgi:hypothetical protein